MTPYTEDAEGSGRYVSSGPIVWTVTLGLTTLLLALLKQALWLVVPFLLAIIVYYALIPPVRRLMLAGVDRQKAAALVAGFFFVGAVLVMVPVVSWIAANAVSSEEALYRYLAAGRALADKTLTMLEARFDFLARMNFHAQMGSHIAQLGEGNLQKEVGAALLGAAAWLPSLLLAPFFAFFFLRDGQRFLKFVGSAVPNAYFERTLYMIERVDTTARAYFEGLLKLTVLDTICLGLGLWVIGVPSAVVLGLLAAVLAWIPVVGPIIGGLLAAGVARLIL